MTEVCAWVNGIGIRHDFVWDVGVYKRCKRCGKRVIG